MLSLMSRRWPSNADVLTLVTLPILDFRLSTASRQQQTRECEFFSRCLWSSWIVPENSVDNLEEYCKCCLLAHVLWWSFMIFTAKVITQSASVLLLIKPTDWSTKPLQVLPTCSCIQVVLYDFYCEGCSKCQCATTDDANGLVCEAFFFITVQTFIICQYSEWLKCSESSFCEGYLHLGSWNYPPS